MRLPLGMLLATLLVLALTGSPVPAGAAEGGNQTIGVTGHWVVEVREPDGTPVTRREFHNALLNPGVIPRLLHGLFTAGLMDVHILCSILPGCVVPCPDGPCRIVEPRLVVSASPSIFKNLTKTNVAGGFQLAGSAVVSSTTTIRRFTTGVSTCGTATTPPDCVAATRPREILTGTTLSPGIDVVAGQQVLVTITITFATAAPATTSQTVAPPR